MKQWYIYDDEYVRKVEAEDIVSDKAYLLFYIKKDLKSFKRQTLAQIFQ